jgi:hypothetical protein
MGRQSTRRAVLEAVPVGRGLGRRMVVADRDQVLLEQQAKELQVLAQAMPADHRKRPGDHELVICLTVSTSPCDWFSSCLPFSRY